MISTMPVTREALVRRAAALVPRLRERAVGAGGTTVKGRFLAEEGTIELCWVRENPSMHG